MSEYIIATPCGVDRHGYIFAVGLSTRVLHLQAASAISKWCAFDLFVSQDFGRQWQNLTASSGGRVASFWDFDWGANVDQGAEKSFKDETILATVYESAAHMKGPYPGWDKDMQFVVSHDFFKSTHRKLVPCGNQFEVPPPARPRAQPKPCHSTQASRM